MHILYKIYNDFGLLNFWGYGTLLTLEKNLARKVVYRRPRRGKMARVAPWSSPTLHSASRVVDPLHVIPQMQSSRDFVKVRNLSGVQLPTAKPISKYWLHNSPQITNIYCFRLLATLLCRLCYP